MVRLDRRDVLPRAVELVKRWTRRLKAEPIVHEASFIRSRP
jgi:hypothetical protein